ncbi:MULTISPECIES: DUF3107 domain-containing protein [unclassified Corynebacterium]|uniref:DUF3107 domain-containing protein n=1 Tax=unclassified Corynebacterium TaxID=2624378 RepID=UPI0021A9C2E1|nr:MULTISPECIES: DUF3107 domain-containing protein [unclassified Corynebacterium]MCT1451877.1 DUF3107 domain-containing protein [Corynebacterium sp. p3-SID1145]MCT1461148.1 DUF3107 domain-containing protein [Corynebacterium sp. p3-SID1140]MDN8595152.1 DUF3107 domain-containing protein [Corynebacterium sp. P4_F2]WKK56614.1 DUF3107 domain-containing protein [Corynebacterium sp. P4-C1]WKK64051.1 DUF3107 domain-containing protein [Corynebacterium sp. P8-C1]
MEIKIGLADSHRELSITSTKEQDELLGEITSAIESGAPTVALDDERGMKYVVRTERILYVELGNSSPRAVGFSA